MNKKLIFIGLLSVMVALVNFTGCEKRGSADLPPETITIMKLKKPEYKDFIIAYAGRDSIIAYRTNKNGLDGRSGYSPYWELPDNWLLVDWKWNFPLLPIGGNVLLENKTWDKLTHALQTWPLETPHISQPIESVYYIKASKLAKFLAKTYEPEVITHVINRQIDWPVDEEEAKEIVQTMDSIWTMFQTDLSIVIKERDLEKLLEMK